MIKAIKRHQQTTKRKYITKKECYTGINTRLNVLVKTLGNFSHPTSSIKGTFSIDIEEINDPNTCDYQVVKASIDMSVDRTIEGNLNNIIKDCRIDYWTGYSKSATEDYDNTLTAYFNAQDLNLNLPNPVNPCK